MVQGTDAHGHTQTGTAVQVAPHVFATAAHVVADPATGVLYAAIFVHPAYNIPVPTPGIALADSWYDSTYFANPAAVDASAHDIAFIRVAADHPLPKYPAFYPVAAAVDIGISSNPDSCTPGYLGNPNADPWVIIGNLNGQAFSWFHGDAGWLWCFNDINTHTTTVGYPELVNGQPNYNVFPYEDVYSELQGNVLNGYDQHGSPVYVHYELYHPSASSLASIAAFTTISPGDSGGPVFGEDYVNHGQFPNWVLLGISGSQVIDPSSRIGGLASGDFPYNHASIASNVAWSPANLIVIGAPSEGATYPRQAVPNFSATAGQITSQLQWSSNIDGALGMGGTIVAVNRLTPGAHTITASIPGTTSATKSVHITVTAPVSVSASPSVVPVGLYAGSGPYTLSYNAPGYSSLDWFRSVNNGTYQLFMTTTGVGTYGGTIGIGTQYAYKAYPHGNSTNVLGTASVRGQLASAPTMSATPTTVVIPATQSTGHFSYQWSAQGYPSLDLRGRINGGSWRPVVWIPATGTSGDNISVNTTYEYQFLPHNDTTHVLGSLTIHGVAVTPPSCHINPAVVIVPPGATTGAFGFDWTAAGYTSLDLWGKVDSNPWHFALVIPPSGSSGDNIPVGHTWQYRFYPHADSTHILCSLSVTAHH